MDETVTRTEPTAETEATSPELTKEALRSGAGPHRFRDSRGVVYRQVGRCGQLVREGILVPEGMLASARAAAPRTKKDRARARAGLPFRTKGGLL